MSFDVIQAGHLTPRHLGRLARVASGGPFRRMRYFRASFPNRAALVITLRFEDGTAIPVSPNAWLHVMEEDFPSGGDNPRQEHITAKTAYTAESLEDHRRAPSEWDAVVYDREGMAWTAGAVFGWFSKHVSAADAITSEALVRDYGPITD